jgi:signal transduction histidine kinase
MSIKLLQARSLSKTHGHLRVLKKVTFDLKPGEVLGLVGRRGSGKSTLLNLIGGAMPPSGGEIIFAGKDHSVKNVAAARQAGIELVYQTPQLLNNLDVVHNVFLGHEIGWRGAIGLRSWEEMYTRTRDLLGSLDLAPAFIHKKTSDLTDEHRHLVAFARAVCLPPKLLLLDDFLPNLSFRRQELILKHIQALRENGAGIIISSDNLNHLFKVTDRILVLFEGKVSAIRRTAEVTPRDIVELIVGAGNPKQVTPVIWALESYHAAQNQTKELFRQQAALHENLEASDNLNRQLVKKLSAQVSASDGLNTALQAAQRRLLTEREEERKALARELHDSVIQDLLSANYLLEESEERLNAGEQGEGLEPVRNEIRQVVGDLRQLCRDLRPPTIDNHGLAAAIRSHAQEWQERSGIAIEIEVDNKLGRLPETTEITIFRIVQEGLNNIGKHATAKNASVNVQRTSKDNLRVQIIDDGKGMAPSLDLVDLSSQKHFGLLGISERAALLGGTMTTDSPEEGGFILQVEIPSPYPS